MVNSHSQQAAAPIDFVRDIKPLLERSCMNCHGPSKPKGGFRVDGPEHIVKGGESGHAAIEPGNGAGSILVRYILGAVKEMEMPPLDSRDKYPALNDSEIGLFRTWIDQGAKWPDGIVLAAAGPPRSARTAVEVTALPKEVEDFFNAIRIGDMKHLERMLVDSAPSSARDQTGNTPLMQAAFYLQSAQLQYFLDTGADVNATNKAGLTALMKAVPDLEKTRLLLKKGAQVNAATEFGNTALSIACRTHGSLPVVQELLKHGANVTATNRVGGNALMAAVESGDDAVVRILLKNNADPNSTTRIPESDSEVSALMLAAQLGHLHCVKLLLESGADINLTLLHGNALHFAAFTDRAEIVRLLLDRGINVNTPGRRLLSFRNDTGFTPLIYAAMNERNDPTVLQWLLERGAEVNAKASSGESALSVARLRGETKLVSLLLKAGAKEDFERAKVTAVLPSGAAAKAHFADYRTSAGKGVTLLLESAQRLTDKIGNRCSTCHQQAQPAMARRLGREKGMSFPEDIAARQYEQSIRASSRGKEWVIEESLPVPSIAAWTLIGLKASNHAADTLTDNYAYSLARYQFQDGRWITKAARPPTDYSDVTSTALAVQALKAYAPPTMASQFEEKISRALQWLRSYQPASTEERALQMLGLHWGGSDPSTLRPMKDALLAEQRDDGGWSQLSTLQSDAYATGLSLVALHQAGGLPASDQAYRKGLQFLVRQQQADGSWFVRSRASPVQVAIGGVFSHGENQWISSSATSWSTLALLLADGE